MGEQTEYLQIMAEKYTLNWHTFSEHLQVMFKDLYQEGRYTDVTLVSDDQTQFKAHKIVLSACSPVFKKIIDSNPSQHPLIYLRGVQSYEVESIGVAVAVAVAVFVDLVFIVVVGAVVGVGVAVSVV